MYGFVSLQTRHIMYMRMLMMVEKNWLGPTTSDRPMITRKHTESRTDFLCAQNEEREKKSTKLNNTQHSSKFYKKINNEKRVRQQSNETLNDSLFTSRGTSTTAMVKSYGARALCSVSTQWLIAAQLQCVCNWIDHHVHAKKKNSEPIWKRSERKW